MTIGRRQFVRNSTLVLGAALLPRKSTLAASFDARIDVILNEELGTISPNIYGTSPKTSVGSSTTASGSAKTRRSPTSTAFAKVSWTPCRKLIHR